MDLNDIDSVCFLKVIKYNRCDSACASQMTLVRVFFQNFQILSPHCVLSYTEDVFHISRLNNYYAESYTGWCKSLSVGHFKIWVTNQIFLKQFATLPAPILTTVFKSNPKRNFYEFLLCKNNEFSLLLFSDRSTFGHLI